MRLCVASLLGASFLAVFGAISVSAQDDGVATVETDPDADGAVSLADIQPADTPPSQPQAKPQTKPDVELVWSQFLATSIREDVEDEPLYGGRVDLLVELPGSAIGLDDSITVNIHPEFRYGEGINGQIGLIPAQTGLFYPSDDGEEFDLSVRIKKTWQSGVSLEVGKVNALDIIKDVPIIGGGGIEGFQNLAFALPPSTIVPQELVGAMLTVPTSKVIYRLWVFDPFLRTQDSGFEDPFGTGVGALASATFITRMGGQPGFYTVKFAGTTRTGPPNEVLPPPLIAPFGSAFGRKQGTASLTLAGYQFLDTYADAPGKGWGVFGQVFVSDGDPTPLDISGFFGISGDVPGRPQDRFGLAWYRYSLSDGLIDDLAGRLALEDEEGVEAFYTFQVAKPLRVTASAQYIDSGVTARKPGWVASLRAVTRF